ncbi:GNAT family N-acetyltransferase [Nonomuraea sp. 3-1Str]|uniref:GNAT family N-acetyltransferase n=1 Tax=Nonomuraea sp. 3-1Str TaxID=2929801 RepID=UPI00285CAFA0|nr:GNAT family N-acetyltransferase [Nonomuraea sp. 3-1Str]MDR8409335.1 GNAT family N-acetyltransferase [Nonomuraea sp. 3-1Str]
MLPRAVLSTGSLVLRAPAESDVEGMTATGADPVAARFLTSLPSPYTERDAREHLAVAARRWEEGGAEFTIAQNGAYAGGLRVSAPDPWGAVEIGYLVAPWARGKGVATAAVRAVTEWLFDQGVHRVELRVAAENVASLRVALKAGFREEGRRRDARETRDGRLTDDVLFGRLALDAGEEAPPYLPLLEGGELTDGVVRLVPIEPGDTEDFHRMMAQPSVAAYAMGPAATLEEIERRCRNTGYWWVTAQRAELAIRDAESGAFAGHVQLAHVVPVLGQAMVGYSLLEEFRGRGFMTRTVRLLVDWAFANTPLHRITAGTNERNRASHAVLERAGFTRECVHRELFPAADGTRADDVQWVRLRSR